MRLVSMLRPYRGHVIASAVLAWLIAGVSMIVPYYTGRIIDDLNRHHSAAQTHRDVYVLLAAGVVVMLLSAQRRVVSGTISLGLEKHLRERVLNHLARLSFSYYDRHQTGQLLSRATSDVTQVRFFLGYGLTYFFMHLGKLLVVPVLIYLVSPPLALVVYAMMPLIFLISLRFSRVSTPVLREIQQKEADVTTAAEENIVGTRVVRAFGQEHNEVERFRVLAGRVVEQERKSAVLTAKYRPLYNVIPNIGLAAVVLIAATQIHSGALTYGQFFAFYGYMLMLIGPVRIVGNLLGRAQRATASGQRLFEILDADEVLPQRDEPIPLPAGNGASARGASEVRFESVRFTYGDGHAAIDDLTLDIPAGSTVALLGPTGCGKTTLTSLVPRFYDPEAGRVLIDGVDARDLPLRELRQTVGIVNQEPFLFSASVADNLRFGAPDASDDDLWRALESAQAVDFVRRLPDGLETLIGERGLTLSGGQRQRVAIARALLVDPRILILDDATASVDSRVEARITTALHAATRGRTTILVAHRPSTIALADRIVIMDRGAIADQGTHDELIERNALYRQIHEQRAARREFLLPGAPAPTAIDEDEEPHGLSPDELERVEHDALAADADETDRARRDNDGDDKPHTRDEVVAP